MRFERLVTPAVRQRMLECARSFRREPQPSEALLWNALRRKQMRGLKFRRQQPIGSFIVDFYCDAVGLVIEVDGPVHEQRKAADMERQELLESLGLYVLRIPAYDVERDIQTVLSQIESELNRQALPSPSGRGAGGEGRPSHG